MIDLQYFPSDKEVFEQLFQRYGQVPMLFDTASQTLLRVRAVLFGGIASMNLFVHMVNTQRHNRQPVNGTARRFRVQRSVRMRFNAIMSKNADDGLVEFFDVVVPLLIQTVDAPFDPCDFRIGNVGTAGDVLFVPEVVVPAMLFAGQFQEIGRQFAIGSLLMPKLHRVPVKVGNRFNVEHGHSGVRVYRSLPHGGGLGGGDSEMSIAPHPNPLPEGEGTVCRSRGTGKFPGLAEG